jgi:hypothetical protein
VRARDTADRCRSILSTKRELVSPTDIRVNAVDETNRESVDTVAR